MILKTFTVEYSEVVSVIETNIQISEDYDLDFYKDKIYPSTYLFDATWDTGAMVSVISTKVINELGLKPTGKETVYHGGGACVSYKYLVNMFLPNDVVFASLEVIGMPISVDVLIGMDIISKGDFAITASEGKTVFSFQIPSTNKIIFKK